jgi:hypothetical protein
VGVSGSHVGQVASVRGTSMRQQSKTSALIDKKMSFIIIWEGGEAHILGCRL